jgi:hypothetical protein
MKWIGSVLDFFFTRRRSGAIVLDSENDACGEAGYRLHGDATEVVRINQEWPQGVGVCICSDVIVEGATHPKEQEALRSLMAGTDRRLRLERQPGASHAANALAVVAIWRSEKGAQQRATIGWLPEKVAVLIAAEHHSATVSARIRRMVVETPGAPAKLHIDVGGPSR